MVVPGQGDQSQIVAGKGFMGARQQLPERLFRRRKPSQTVIDDAKIVG